MLIKASEQRPTAPAHSNLLPYPSWLTWRKATKTSCRDSFRWRSAEQPLPSAVRLGLLFCFIPFEPPPVPSGTTTNLSSNRAGPDLAANSRRVLLGRGRGGGGNRLLPAGDGNYFSQRASATLPSVGRLCLRSFTCGGEQLVASLRWMLRSEAALQETLLAFFLLIGICLHRDC